LVAVKIQEQEFLKMGRLSAIVAVEKGVKSRVHAAITELYKLAQKPALFDGMTRRFVPKTSDDSEQPVQNTVVQKNARDMVASFETLTTELMLVEARKDWTNCAAKGTVKLGGSTVIEGAPVSYLLFLEKLLTEMRTFASALPTLDESEVWSFDEQSGLMRAAPTQTHQTKKAQRPIVLYDATQVHPAQTQLITEDIVVGHWHQEKRSGAISRPEREALVDRIDKTLIAVKVAREDANAFEEVLTPDVTKGLFDYIIRGTINP
jgi:hypothetical protein